MNIYGSGDPASSNVNYIGLRADIDALPMPENNNDLEYRTKTNHAHMCGHDGHTSILIAVAKILHLHKSKIGSN